MVQGGGFQGGGLNGIKPSMIGWWWNLIVPFTRSALLYSAVPILAECHYSNIRDSNVCIGMTIRVLAFSTEDDTGIGIFDWGRYGYWQFWLRTICVRAFFLLRTIRVLAFLTEDDTGTDFFDWGRYGYWHFWLRTILVPAFLTEDDTGTGQVQYRN